MLFVHPFGHCAAIVTPSSAIHQLSAGFLTHSDAIAPASRQQFSLFIGRIPPFSLTRRWENTQNRPIC
jgi:hypothetical protein